MTAGPRPLETTAGLATGTPAPLAHGVGSASGLPLPLDLVLQAGAATVVLSFLIAALWWREPRLTDPGTPPPVTGHWLRYPVLILTLYLTGNALIGPRGPQNPAAHALFVWLWVGLVPFSLLFGPVWRAVNPLRTLFTLLGLPRRGLRPLPPGRSTAWPAAAFLLVFVWFELVAPHGGDPVAVGLFFLGYGLSQLVLATLRGEEWFARGDCFEVYSGLAARLRPISRLATDAVPGIAAFLAVWWGSTVYDSASASPVWARFVRGAGLSLLVDTAGLVVICALVLLAVRATAGKLDVTMSLVPIAVGYTLAHYLSLLIVEAPRGVLLLAGSDAPWNVTPAPEVIAGAQIALILAGHVIGVIVAHDRALALTRSLTPQRPVLAVLADELPMVLFMIGCTWAGLFLLFVR
ncbi:hypothetical protein QLQ12_02405 [Actinoplanes sp. NEAU-A12]|uniref:Uncharacterized protein n=1 Tax=Actinoplanes sandaracinus TaxID=3045177 RepID=A0ABT6WCI7_9ACTN|nr:hypothetical protein [Actinoplanes sandaracinus]MDI6097450.1 hypothetical protein [Actinoplanes sandaracinus]